MDRLRARAIESFWIVRLLLGAPTKDVNGVISFPSGSAVSGNGWVGQLKRLGGGTAVPLVLPGHHAARARSPATVGGGAAWRPRPLRNCDRRQDQLVPVRRSDHVERLSEGRHGLSGIPHDRQRHLHRGAIEQAMIGVFFDGDGDRDRSIRRMLLPLTAPSAVSRSCVSPSPSIRASRARSTSRSSGGDFNCEENCIRTSDRVRIRVRGLPPASRSPTSARTVDTQQTPTPALSATVHTPRSRT